MVCCHVGRPATTDGAFDAEVDMAKVVEAKRLRRQEREVTVKADDTEGLVSRVNAGKAAAATARTSMAKRRRVDLLVVPIRRDLPVLGMESGNSGPLPGYPQSRGAIPGIFEFAMC